MSSTVFMSTEHETPPRAGSKDGLQDVVPKLESNHLQEIDANQSTYIGVEAAAAASTVYGRYSKWVLYLSIALAVYYFSLDQMTTPNYLPFAASAYGKHSLISAIQVAQSATVACGRPIVAKVADVRSRTQACVLVLMFYVLGYIVTASAHDIKSFTVCSVLCSIGATGLELMVSVIIADITPLKWRGAALSVLSLPFVINGFIGSNIATRVNEHLGWRWGYGMFAIIVWAFLAPLILTLLWAERKARIFCPTPEATTSDDSLLFKGWMFCQQLDLVGLVLTGASVALILLPLTLATNAKGGWHNPSMIAMLVVGCVLIPITALWEIKFAKYPFLGQRLLTNRTVVISVLILFFNYLTLRLLITYLYSFILVTRPWSLLHATYFAKTQTVALAVFGTVGGFVLRCMHRHKLLLIVGSGIYLFGVALMIHSRSAQSSVAEIVWTQILQGIGQAFAMTCCMVSSQASVSHVNMAITTALNLMSTDIGAAVGTAVAGAIWTNTMPQKLAQHLPHVNATYRAELFGSITVVSALSYDDPIRQGVISAYSDVMKIIAIAATCIVAIPLALSFFIPDCYLGDKHNAVETADLKIEQGDPLPATLEMNKGPLSDETYTSNCSA